MSEQIRKAIQQITGTVNNDNATYVLCKVDSVDTSKRTCDVTVLSDFATSVPDVQIMAGVEDGMLLVPSVGSQVVVCIADSRTPYVSMYSQLDKVMFVVGEMGITITTDGVQINDGSLGGLIKIEQLVSKINTIEQDINTLKTVFSSWTPVPNDGGAALKAAAATWYAQQLQQTAKADLENTSVTHGEQV